MSQPIKNAFAKPGAGGAAMSTPQHYMATIQRRLAGIETFDPQEVAKDQAKRAKIVDQRELKRLAAQRKRQHAKNHAQDALSGATRTSLDGNTGGGT